MAVAFVLEFEGATLDEYNKVSYELMGLEPEGKTPPGAIFHWVASTDDGILVTDVWESDEAFQQFANDQIGPHTAAVGMAEPKITRHEVHNYFRA